MSRNETDQSGSLAVEYASTDQMDRQGVTADAKPSCVALVPVTKITQRSTGPIRLLLRPNSIFVAHLIATVERVPQTRSLRRATASDANAAYISGRQRIAGAGLRARQTI
ncbi:MAG: hypothetical protein KGK01_02675 [Bradyrhizobium sp.]|uniref:hypothetical protein n=1 Tax=Bradyrhizobium sp. TaxID=376 RepID=UPI00238D21CD|nr:hypothetical protein [Bradyrhizobium sp.]MDE2065808.1 hypothetical protein [Bradyrhizobium sp.]MDE2241366.1 hypothetical protein [Bradyrhizobium sp.]